MSLHKSIWFCDENGLFGKLVPDGSAHLDLPLVSAGFPHDLDRLDQDTLFIVGVLCASSLLALFDSKLLLEAPLQECLDDVSVGYQELHVGVHGVEKKLDGDGRV